LQTTLGLNKIYMMIDNLWLIISKSLTIHPS
jgi:hypothetical protein